MQSTLRPRAAMAVCLCTLLVSGSPTLVFAQTPAVTGPRLISLIVIEGEGAINNVKQRTAREAVVQVEDENHRPVAGAAVTFAAPSQGASGSFLNGARSVTVLSDNQGRAVARGFRPNTVQGNVQIRVNANYQGKTANTVINMTNVLAAGAATAAGIGISAKLITILAIGAAAAAGGAIAATRGGGGGSNTGTTGPPTGGPTGPAAIVITPGTPTVGGPH